MEGPDWSHDILPVKKSSRKKNLTGKLQLDKQSRSPEMNVYERNFHLGKSLVKDMRSLIIDDIGEKVEMFQQHSTREVLQS